MQLQMQLATITTIINNIVSPFISIAISAVVLRLCRFLCPTELGRLCEQCFFFCFAQHGFGSSLSLRFASVWAQSIQIRRFTANKPCCSRAQVSECRSSRHFGCVGALSLIFGLQVQVWDAGAARTHLYGPLILAGSSHLGNRFTS